MSTIDENALKAGARAIRLNYDAEYEEDASDWWCDRLARAAITAYLTATKDAQAERVRVLEEENEQLKIGLEVAEKLYRETLGMKGDAGYG